jgi:hypothetical protein
LLAVGYDQLKKLLLHSFGDHLSHDADLSSDLLDVLFDMLVDGDFDARNFFLIQVSKFSPDIPPITALTHTVIQNKDVVILLFQLVPLFPISVQMELFDTFTSILVNCPSNLATCCEAGLISELTWSIPGITRAICKEKEESHLYHTKRRKAIEEDLEARSPPAESAMGHGDKSKDPTNEHRVLLDKVVHLIQVLARYSITVRELKQLLNLVKPKKTSLFIGNYISLQELLGPNLDDHVDDGYCLESKMLTTWTVLRSIHHILAFQAEMRGEFFGKKDGDAGQAASAVKKTTRGIPLWTFNFNGKTSQFVLSSLPQWPPAGGNFSFSTWLNIESFESPSVIRNFRPRLLSFLTAENYGFEFYFSEGFLHYHIRCPSGGGDPADVQYHKFDFQFSPKKWYHVALTFISSSRIWGKSSEIKLYVNSAYTQKIGIRGQVQVFKNVAAGRIGCGSYGSFCLENEKFQVSQSRANRQRFASQRNPSTLGMTQSATIPDKRDRPRRSGRRNSADSRRLSLMDRAGTTLEIETKDPSEKFTFFGQMCAIYFFEEELQQKEISEIFLLGPTHYSDFRSNTIRGL